MRKKIHKNHQEDVSVATRYDAEMMQYDVHTLAETSFPVLLQWRTADDTRSSAQTDSEYRMSLSQQHAFLSAFPMDALTVNDLQKDSLRSLVSL